MYFDVFGYLVVIFCVLGGVIIEFEDEVVDNGICGELCLMIICIWIVIDGFGNVVQCVQEISMVLFNLDQVVFLGNFDGIDNLVLDCSVVLVNLEFIDFEYIGYLMINGINLYVNIYCLVVMNYIDE